MQANQNKEIAQNPLRYNNILNKLRDFRCGLEDDKFEQPGEFYFKVFFYFDGTNTTTDRMSNGLLGCNFDEVDQILSDPDNYTVKHDGNDKPIRPVLNTNNAYYYLRLNGEEERADKLKTFIRMLSDISTNKPWYFQSVEGINTALERKMYDEGEIKLEEKRKSIKLTCLPDAYDMRIGTLLDLYKDVAYSYVLKKEILPANMRKFDMGIFIFSTPIRQLVSTDFTLGTGNFLQHRDSKYNKPQIFDNSTSARLGVNPINLKNQSKTNYFASAKYIEFQNCEIMYSSGTTGYSEIKNDEGFEQKFTIEIAFDDAYEERYNEYIMRTIGDFVARDLYKDLDQAAPVSSDTFASDAAETISAEDMTSKKNLLGTPLYDNRYFDENAAKQSTRTPDDVNLDNLQNQFINVANNQPLGTIRKPNDPNTGAKKGLVENAMNQLVGSTIGSVQGWVKNKFLGNLKEYTLTDFRIGDIDRVLSYFKTDKPVTITNSYLGGAQYSPEDIARLQGDLGGENIRGSEQSEISREITPEDIRNGAQKEHNTEITPDTIHTDEYTAAESRITSKRTLADPQRIAAVRQMNISKSLINHL